MSKVDAQAAKMEANIAENTGKTVAQWVKAVQGSGLEKHGQIVKWLKSDHGFTHGYANLVAHRALQSSHAEADDGDLVTAQYAGPKADLKPIYDKVISIVQGKNPEGRLEASGSFNAMVSHRVRVASTEDVDAAVEGWLKEAFVAAG